MSQKGQSEIEALLVNNLSASELRSLADEVDEDGSGGAMPFDPSDLTVRELEGKLEQGSFGDNQLQALLEAEKDRKDRVTAREAIQEQLTAPEAEGLEWEELDIADIEEAVTEAEGEVLEATLRDMDFKKKDGDTLQDATAKAIIRQNDGNAVTYRRVFGACEECLASNRVVRGKNGFNATKCKKCSGD